MLLVATRAYRRATLPQRLQLAAAATYLASFAALLAYGRAGSGVGEAFSIPIVLAALGGTAWSGAAAGLVATVLYEAALVFAGEAPAPARLALHLGAYVGAGVVVGAFAAYARGLVSDSVHTLEALLHLARRDLETASLTSGGLERALARRIADGARFALLVGEVECGAAPQQAVAAARAALPAEAEVARVGASRLAALVSLPSEQAAEAAAAELEQGLLEGCGAAVFGWALHPEQGADALSLFGAASERLGDRRRRGSFAA